MEKTLLSRSISYPMLLLYGLGTMIGGGFYALIGTIASTADMATPFAFLLAGLLALINAFTYGELSSRYPYSASEARYVKEAFNRKWVVILVGVLVIATGIVSAATLSVATVGFLQDFFSFSKALGIVLLVAAMCGLSIWGVKKAVWAVLIITFLEIAALLYIFFFGMENLQNIGEITSKIATLPFDTFLLVGVFSGSFLAFYAFLGFEDMANMAEEVKDERKTLPKAMLGSIILTTIVYVVVSSVAVLTISPAELAAAGTPLAKVVESAGPYAIIFLTIVSVLTGINGALVQIIMASRVLYGLGKDNKNIEIFSHVNKKTQTPIEATLFASIIVLILALFFPLRDLAEMTSTIILVLFVLLNLALLKLKKDKRKYPKGTSIYPFWLPVLGLFTCLAMLVFKIWTTL